MPYKDGENVFITQLYIFKCLKINFNFASSIKPISVFNVFISTSFNRNKALRRNDSWYFGKDTDSSSQNSLAGRRIKISSQGFGYGTRDGINFSSRDFEL